MTKVELVNKIYAKTDLHTKIAIEDMLNKTIEVLKEELISGTEITLANFGTFRVVDRAPRKGRNPSTSKAITIPACRSVKFTLSRNFKKSLQK